MREELVFELLHGDAGGVDGDRHAGDDGAGVVADRDAEGAQTGLERAVGDGVAAFTDEPLALVGVRGVVGEEHLPHRGLCGGQPLTGLDRDREQARVRGAGRGDGDHLVAVEHADRDVLTDGLAQAVERRLGAGGHALAAEVAGAEAQHAGRDLEVPVDVADVAQAPQGLEHAVGGRPGEAGRGGDLGGRAGGVALVERFEDRERPLDRLDRFPHVCTPVLVADSDVRAWQVASPRVRSPYHDVSQLSIQ